MSRLLGRSNDVLSISDELQYDFPKYQKDETIIPWDEIEKTKNDVFEYLPDVAIDFINKEKIDVLKSPFRLYTFTSVPEYKDEKRFIRFPSKNNKKEYLREYAFYLGLLLSSYQTDNEEEYLEIGKEYDDILPLVLDYIYLKHNNIEDRYSLKYLNFLKKYTKSFKKSHKLYEEFYNFSSNAETRELSDSQYNIFMNLSYEKDEEMERIIMQHMIKLSSFDGSLQIIDKNYSKDEIKKLIEALMLNKDESRSSILYERGIESYGYRSLRKEINKYKKA